MAKPIKFCCTEQFKTALVKRIEEVLQEREDHQDKVEKFLKDDVTLQPGKEDGSKEACDSRNGKMDHEGIDLETPKDRTA
jgi:hypothetical protein